MAPANDAREGSALRCKYALELLARRWRCLAVVPVSMGSFEGLIAYGGKQPSISRLP